MPSRPPVWHRNLGLTEKATRVAQKTDRSFLGDSYVHCNVFLFGACRVHFRRTNLLRAARSAQQTVQLPPNERAAWNRLKIAIMELYSRYESTETSRKRHFAPGPERL